MSVIALNVAPSLNRWAVLHNEVVLATFATKAEAERAALALAARHPKKDTAAVNLSSEDGGFSSIKVF